MTFDEIWSQLRRKSARLNEPDTVVEFKPDNLKQLLRQVYEQGEKSGKQQAKASVSAGLGPSDPFSNLFKGMT